MPRDYAIGFVTMSCAELEQAEKSNVKAEKKTNIRRRRTELDLGQSIKELRKARGLSLTDLVDATGVSHSTISRIENDKISPSWEIVVNLCKALNVEIGELLSTTDKELPAPDHNDVLVIRRDEAAVATFRGHTYELHSDANPHRNFHVTVVRHNYFSLEEAGGLQSHSGEEFTYVLDGSLEVHVEGRDPVELGPGDSIRFPSTIPHAYVSLSKTGVKTLEVTHGSSGEHLQFVPAKTGGKKKRKK